MANNNGKGNGKKNGKGRPKVKIDLETVEKLGQLQCTIKEISAFMNIPESTLKTRDDFSTAFQKGKEVGKMSLRRIQFTLAKKSPAMAIWLGKQYLGQMDTVQVSNEEFESRIGIIPDVKGSNQEIPNRVKKFLN